MTIIAYHPANRSAPIEQGIVDRRLVQWKSQRFPGRHERGCGIVGVWPSLGVLLQIYGSTNGVSNRPQSPFLWTQPITLLVVGLVIVLLLLQQPTFFLVFFFLLLFRDIVPQFHSFLERLDFSFGFGLMELYLLVLSFLLGIVCQSSGTLLLGWFVAVAGVPVANSLVFSGQLVFLSFGTRP